ncbi:MAG: PAS domain-containing sensor histidine kinase [bacterium]
MEMEEILPQLFGNSPIGIYVIQDKRFQFVNSEFERISGYSAQDLLGTVSLDMVQPEDRDRVRRCAAEMLKGMSLTPYQFRTITKGEQTKWILETVVPIEYRGSRAVLGNFMDITNQKDTEKELQNYRDHLQELVKDRTAALKTVVRRLRLEVKERKAAAQAVRDLNDVLEQRVKERTLDLERAYQELTELDQMKDHFLSSVSHEFRTPLTSIRSFSEILLDYNEMDPATQREFLRIIHSESMRLTRLINDVLELSRIGAGKMIWNDAPCSLGDIIRDAADALGQLLSQKRLQLSLEVPQPLPSVFADRDRIQQVVTNLLSNALKFSFEGGRILIRVEPFQGLRSGDPREWLRVSVADKGIGIEEKNLDTVFDRFYQVCEDHMTGKPEGTGLGLAICKEIVNRYRGDIWVKSRKGEGATFFFTLPATPDTGDSAASGQTPAHPSAESPLAREPRTAVTPLPT